MRTSVIVGCLGLFLLAPTGCGKKDESDSAGKGSAAKTGAKAKAGAGGDTFASRTIEMQEFSVTVDVPTGWNEQKFGGGLLFTKPGGIFGSTLMVGQTCEGSCGSIAANIDGMAAGQVKMHGSYYPNAKIVKQGAVAAGGGEFQLDLARKDGSKAAQYKLVRFQDGWKQAVNCNAMLLKADAKLMPKFTALCNGMKITQKTAP